VAGDVPAPGGGRLGREAGARATPEADRRAAAAPPDALASRRAHGYATDLWTTRRIATVIEEQLGVTYHPAHLSRVLADIGWSCQKPERRALERNERAIAQWKRAGWVAIKKKPGA
jgi:transposase